MKHVGTVTLESERLLLRRLCVEDAQILYNGVRGSAEVAKYMLWQPDNTVEDTKVFLTNLVSEYEKEDFYQWGIVEKSTETLIGMIALFVKDTRSMTGKPAYLIAKDKWGNGYIAEALKEIIRLGFEVIGFNRIAADCLTDNPASGKAMEKAGMIYEGTARQLYLSKQGFSDARRYAIIKDDYCRQNDLKKG